MDDNDVDALNKVLASLGKHKDQLTFDFDTMNSTTGQSALTISSNGTDTISLSEYSGISGDWSTSTGAIGAMASGQYNYTYGGGGSYPTITIGPNTLNNGPILTTGTSGINWNDLNNVRQGTLQVKGDAEFEGDVKINGKSIADTLEKLEERLAILKPNPELEEKWDELRELSKRYKELEKEIIEKEKMWDILKK